MECWTAELSGRAASGKRGGNENPSTWVPTGTITCRWAQTYRENICHLTCRLRETLPVCSRARAACGDGSDPCTSDEWTRLGEDDLHSCLCSRASRHCCSHGDQSSNLFWDDETELLRWKTKGAERQVKYHDSIRLCSISFRQLKGACVRMRARARLCVWERAREQKDKHQVSRRHVPIKWADKSHRVPKKGFWQTGLLFLFEREYFYKHWAEVENTQDCSAGIYNAGQVRRRMNLWESILIHWLFLYWWVATREEPLGAAMIELIWGLVVERNDTVQRHHQGRWWY